MRFLLPWIVLLLSGCVSLPNPTTETIDGRNVEFVMSRHATVPVVFENGLAGKLDWWAKVFPEISKSDTAFVYNRPGYGASDPVSTPRDGQHIVDELRAVLRRKGLHPPYVLVGHSAGGLYMQYFARRYPDEVRALILVDSTHPEQFKGKGSPEHWPGWFRVLFNIWTSRVEKQEFNAIPATGASVLALPSFTGKPVIVLSAQKPMTETSELAKDANEKRKDLARLYPGSRQVWVDSGHGIPLEKPGAVIAAIRAVMP